MSAAPLVSIITPSYNQAAYLEHTLRSVLAQTYTPFEYIVVDGGSSDDSPAIIQRYSDRLAWWVSEPDAGQAEAINKGMQRARGEIVAWLNSDDLYLPGAIQRAVQVMQDDASLGMVFGDAITIDPRGRPINHLTFGQWDLNELMCFRIICQPAVFMRRSVLEKAGLLDPAYHYMLDHHLWVRMARLAPVRYIGAAPDHKLRALPLAAARCHPNAKNIAQAGAFATETLRLLDWMQTQPDLASLVARQRNHILGGAYRLAARYRLDGNQPLAALKTYAQALRYWPRYTLRHWHRIAYAALCLLGAKSLLDRARAGPSQAHSTQLAQQLRSEYSRSEYSRALSSGAQAFPTALEDWPGLNLTAKL